MESADLIPTSLVLNPKTLRMSANPKVSPWPRLSIDYRHVPRAHPCPRPWLRHFHIVGLTVNIDIGLHSSSQSAHLLLQVSQRRESLIAFWQLNCPPCRSLTPLCPSMFTIYLCLIITRRHLRQLPTCAEFSSRKQSLSSPTS